MRLTVLTAWVLCSLAVFSGSPTAASEIDFGLPATFEGELPCADCPGIFYHLDLLPGGVCFLRATFLGRGTGAIRDEMGSWTAKDGEIHLALAHDGPSLFRLGDRDTLQVLDGTGPHIEASAGHTLRRRDSMGTISPRVSILGLVDETGAFLQCPSGRRLTLVSTDRLSGLPPERPVLVALQALISFVPAEDEGAPSLTLRPEKVLEILPAADCPDPTGPN